MPESSLRRHSMGPPRNGEPGEMKGPYNVSEVADSSFDSAKDKHDEAFGDGWKDAHTDALDMKRLGKTQEFKRNFKTISSLGFVSIYMATWEFVLVSLSIGFSNGGLAGIFWCFITTTLCYSTIVASLAESENIPWLPQIGMRANLSCSGIHGAHIRWSISLGLRYANLSESLSERS